MRLRIATFIVAAVCVLGLTGCDPSPAIYSPAPAPSSTPIFKSDEEALAAAKEAYERYRLTVDEIFKSGALDTSELASVAVGHQLEVELAGFAKVREEGLHSTGKTTFKPLTLQQYDKYSTTGESIVVAYVCEDVSDTDVIDAAGKSVVSPDREKTSLYEVTFDLAKDHNKLLVSNIQRWSENPC